MLQRLWLRLGVNTWTARELGDVIVTYLLLPLMLIPVSFVALVLALSHLSLMLSLTGLELALTWLRTHTWDKFLKSTAYDWVKKRIGWKHNGLV